MGLAGLTLRPRARHGLLLVAATAISLAVSPLSSAVVLGAKAPTRPPDTVITASPPNPSASTSASFSFSSTLGGSTFTCRLDAGTWAACTSPRAYGGLAPGSHTFSVRATRKGMTDPSPATYTWTIDTTLPSTPTNLAATTPTATSVRLTWTASTDNVAIGGYDVFRDGASLASVGAVTTYTDTTVLAGSTHTYQVRARDTAGNLSALTAPVSATTPAPPDTIIDSSPPAGTSSTTASFAFHSVPPGATFTCKLDALAAGACTSPTSYPALTQGLHTFTVYATLSGIADPTPATATWTVDTTAPTAPTGLGASALSPTSVQLTWTAASDNLGVTGYSVFRDGSLLATIGAVTTWTDPNVTAGTTPAYTLQAFDIAGNLSPMTPPVSPPPPPLPLDPALTRMPYLTDLVGLNAIVNFATDQSGPVASVSFGPAGGGSCSLTTTVPATRITISLNGVFEYQWKAALTLPAAGSYCYRAYLGAVDLLGSNPAPVFQAQVPVGSTEPFTFAVFGDWGQADASGANPYQAGVMSQVAASGARFAITTGDNGYPSGSQGDFGDLRQVVSGIFGMQFWGGVGSGLAIFPTIGNHGFARNDEVHPHLANWPQDVAVATSGGRNQIDPYPSINGSTPANLPSSWYAFSAGNARFYMLTATWTDTNVGTGTVYGADYLAHWTPTSPEYQWLQADLAAHPSGLKFAFFHYPLYSDQPSESGDTYLQGNSSLEGLLASNGVNIAFNGHAHIYQRNAAASGPGRQGLVSYVTGGGGGQAQSTGTCSAIDRYAVGWSYTNNRGTACGGAPVPTSPAQVHHFLKVTISGSTVTVTPTDSTGATFDVQTLTFNPKPDTFIDSAPAAGTADTSATFTFHASSASATYTCRLDGGAAESCTSPKSYTSLPDGSHTFAVYATVGGVADPLPATWTWTVDATPPAVPTDFAADATSPFSVALSWTAATDNTGVTGYDVYRDGSLLATIAPATSYTDTAVLGDTPYSYAVRARDVAGNVSALTPSIPVTTPAPPAPVFADGFESGDLSAWGSNGGLTVQGTDVHGGAYAAEGDTTNGATYAKRTLPATYADAYARTSFLVKSQVDQVNLLRLRSAADASIGYLYVGTAGQLGFHNDATGSNTVSATIPGPGWHALELHVLAAGSGGVVEVWLDNARVADLSSSGVATGTAPIGQIQVGETQDGRTYDVVFDDAAFGTARLGPVADNPPPVPAGLTANATSPFAVDLAWTASIDDLGIAGYDIFRDGTLVASTAGLGSSYTDTSVVASTAYSYAVRVRDTSGNRSALSTPPVSVTTPAAFPPVFADGFESGDLSAWTSSAGLIVQSTDRRSGVYAAEGNTTNGNVNAKRTLPSSYADAFARVGFKVMRQAANQVTLLMLRDTPATSVGYVYLTSTGLLAFHNDALNTNKTSATAPSRGDWHALELHLGVGGSGTSTVEVWLDGALVTDLSSTATTVGPAPVAIIQVGDVQNGRTYDIVYDDAAFGTARLGPVPDAPPSVPTLTAAASSPFGSVALSWTASTDDIGVTGYSVYRNSSLLASVGTALSYTDSSVLPSTSYTYTVQAFDTSNNPSGQSAQAPVTTPPGPAPVFADAFESGDLSAWTATSGLAIVTSPVHGGTHAVEGATTSAGPNARKTLTTTVADAYGRAWVYVKSLATNATLLGFRSAGSTVGSVYVASNGKLGVIGISGSTGVGSTTGISLNAWHALEFHLTASGATSTTQVWLDGALVSDLAATINAGTATTLDTFQVGDTQTSSRTYDVVYDDAAFGTSRLGPVAYAPPSVPTNVAASAQSPYSVNVTWTASTGGLAIASYDVFRDGSYLGSAPGTATSYLDGTVGAASTHTYQVRAGDTSGNRSALSTPPASATTPADQPPSVPTNVAATAPTSYAVSVTWTASTDDVGLAGYDVYRGGVLLVSLGTVTSYADVAVRGGTQYQYAILARDGMGHMSALSAPASVTPPAAPTPVFVDGFESGNLSQWTPKAGLAAESSDVRSGTWAVEGNTTTGAMYAKKTLPSTYTDAYARVAFKVKSQGSNAVNLLRMRDATSGTSSIGYVYVATTGQLAFHNDATGANKLSTTSPGGGWHVLELHVTVNGASSTVEVWLDGALVTDLSGPATLLANPVGVFQIGETQTGQTYDVLYDDAAFGTARIGL